MIIVDFLIYYLTYWFEKNKKKLVWSTPLQRAIYAIMLAIAGISVFFRRCWCLSVAPPTTNKNAVNKK